MRSRVLKWLVPGLLVLAGVWLFWRSENRPAEKTAHRTVVTAVHSSSTAPDLLAGVPPARTNALAFRLNNTTKPIGQLMGDPHAILLENALIDTAGPLNLSIPAHLRAQGDAGAYIVQSRGPIGAAFRALLRQAGAEMVSYIPNNAYLVHVSADGAKRLAGQPTVQSVIPWEPYYKIQSSLLGLAVKQKLLPAGAALNLGLFADGAPQTIRQIEKLGGKVMAQDISPFGPVVRVQPPANWTALAALPGVQIVEAYHPRIHANDLSRVTVGVSMDTLTNANYLNLSGSNVIVAVDDSGIDATHPDLAGRVFGSPTNDTDGHGTHVAGIIAGDGKESTTVVNAQGSIMPATNGQFRGMAPLAKLLSLGLGNSDQALQEAAALTNALISNNSWNFEGDNTYDLEAASYDAATRDALAGVTGLQPVLFVFSAGNGGALNEHGGAGGGGSDDGSGGNADSIFSPGTAKDVITVGALEQLRNITNMVTDLSSNQSTPWAKMTDSSFQVAGYSSRGNVGIGTEGQFGRYKPDVVAPGTFVVSTRSAQWDEKAYYNPTNHHITAISDFVDPDSLTDPPLQFFIYGNAVQVTIDAFETGSGSPSTPLPIYVWRGTDPNIPGTADLADTNHAVIPPDLPLTPINTGWQCAVGNTTAVTVPYRMIVDVETTNDLGNYYQALSNLNNSLGGDPDSLVPPHYYRYESGTSMATADVSGVLALIQDFFTNTLHTTPSPALLKAMLINGARRSSTSYNFQVQNAINYEGWGLISLPNSVSSTLTNLVGNPGAATNGCTFFADQDPTNALATGDSHTYFVTVSTNAQQALLPLRVTLAWTDPPGDPAAAIKLVNNLDLVVTNLDDPTNPVVYYGNDIPAGSIYNVPRNPNLTNAVPELDSINNVENAFVPGLLGTNYSVTVVGRAVNANAISAQTNNAAGIYEPNVVQDYALVISCGEGEVTNAISVADAAVVSNPTAGQDITFVTATNTPLLNQFVGANSPIINAADVIAFTTNTAFGGNAQVTAGMTNQWHFYVVTNNAVDSSGSSSDVTNAAFVTFLPPTLSVPREGVFAGDITNATRLQADIDLYVTTDSTLTNLNPVAIYNCVNGTQVGASAGGVFNGVALGRGGSEFVVDTNSTAGQVYYVGVKSEDQMASEYDFLALFSSIPFSEMNGNGDEIVHGQPVPVVIPDGTPGKPGSTLDLPVGLALYPIEVGRVVVTNIIGTQNFGDLVGTLTLNGGMPVVLNSHDLRSDPSGIYPMVFDDSGQGDSTLLPAGYNLAPSDGPGSLQDYLGQQGAGQWGLTEADNAPTQNGSVNGFELLIQPHQDLRKGIQATIAGQSWFYTFIDVPAGATNLTINATNLTDPPDFANPLQLVIKFGSRPTLTNADKGPVFLTNGVAVGSGGLGLTNSLSVGPTDVPPIQPGRYWIGVWNPSLTPQTVGLGAVILPATPNSTSGLDFTSAGATAILDDAVSYSDIFITDPLPVASVNVGIFVQHPRISDLVFHLISPSGTRVLLMENRGGTDPNGAGASVVVTNVTVTTVTVTNSLASAVVSDYTAGLTVAGWTVTTNQVSLVNDPANAYQGNNLLALASGSLSTTIPTVPGQSYSVSISYRGPGIAGWWRAESNAIDSINGNNGIIPTTTNYTTVWTNGFEDGSNPNTSAGHYFAGGWLIDFGSIDLLLAASLGSTAYQGSYYIDLDGSNAGGISTNITTVPGMTYTLSFAYSKNPNIASGATPIPQASILINGNPLATLTVSFTNSYASLNWQTTNYVFTATSASTALAFHSLDNPSSLGGVFLDAVGLTTNVINSAVTYTNGEVGKAFQYNGNNGSITAPASTSLAVSNVTMDAWIYPTDLTTPRPIVDYGGAGQYSAFAFWLNTVDGLSHSPGYLHVTVRGQNPLGNPWLDIRTANGPVQMNQWNHVAFTANVTTGSGTIYYNGISVGAYTLSGSAPIIPQSFQPVNLGYRNDQEALSPSSFQGNMDEVSIYNRALSPSEIKAIYNLGTNGKYDPVIFNTSPPKSLAEAQFGVTGQAAATINGSNTTWQTYTTTFTAVTNQTTLTLAGIDPGMLLGPLLVTDPVLVTNVVTNILYLTFTEDTNLTTTPIKFAEPPFVPDLTTTNLFADGFEQTPAGDYTNGQTFGSGWMVTGDQVSIVTDAVNADEGSNFLALASGTVLTNLPTVAGRTYTLTFAYRGPGIAGWWRAENNTNDSSGFGNNPGTVQNITFTNGEVGDAFVYDGSTSFITVPPSTSLAVSNVTLEAWVFPTTLNQRLPVIDYGGAGQLSAIFLWLNTTGGSSVNPGGFFGLERDASGSGLEVDEPNPVVTLNQWNHVAFTVNARTLTGVLYCNGVPVMTNTTTPPLVPASFEDVNLGYRNSASSEGFGSAGLHFLGNMDEASIYNRPLSASEINAIYNLGSAGKFDPSASFPQNLAEAQVSLNGQVQANLSGDNTSWQTETITFTATQNGTPLQITGLEPGMLLDDFTLTQMPGNLYYLPEQPLDAFIGEGAFGDWRLEIQDDRAGAGLTNLLVSWELQLVFANTNAVPASLSGGIGQTNQFIPAGQIAWYQINVPTNANYATNLLLFASAPVNVWFSTNVPPTITNTADVDLLPNSTGNPALLGTNGSPVNVPFAPAYIVPGGTYYLGVQNANTVTVNYGIEVDFDHGNSPVSGLPAVSVVASGSGTTLKWKASSSARFQMQWKDDLTQPWNTDTNVITSSDGNFTFTDDGSQTAPLGATRFYRLVQISP